MAGNMGPGLFKPSSTILYNMTGKTLEDWPSKGISPRKKYIKNRPVLVILQGW